MMSSTVLPIASVAERTLDWMQGCWYWGDAIAIDAVLDADTLEEAGWSTIVAQRVERWAESAPDAWDDALAPGRAIVNLVRASKVGEGAVHRMLAAIQRLPRNKEGVPLLRPHVAEWRDVVWIDSLYHLPCSLAAVGTWLDESVLCNDAVRIAVSTVDLLSTPGGLAHFFDGGLRRNNGVVWSRGMGWALLGLLDLLQILDGKHLERIEEVASLLLGRMEETQEMSGHWRTVLGHVDAGTETSAAAFFVAAALHPGAATLDSVSPKAIDRAQQAVLASIESDGTYTGVSHDTHARWDVGAYERPSLRPSPWGQGAALRALVALSRARLEPERSLD